MGKNIFYFVVAVVILALVAGVIFVFTRQEQQQVQRSEPVQEEQGLGSQLNQNPGSQVPETNPFEQTQTNPFEGYTNPFE